MGKLILYAPNVHVGGGYVLLQSLVTTWTRADVTVAAFLDARVETRLRIPAGWTVSWVKPRVLSRMRAEIKLHGVCSEGDVVLCFHGLPPVLPSHGRVVVFLQNRHYVRTEWRALSARTAVRLAFERAIGRVFRRRVAEYIVQTSSMARELGRWWGSASSAGRPLIRTFPFVAKLPAAGEQGRSPEFEWDFVYAADGEAHKNHRRLLEAWAELSQEGIKPTLALTLGERDDKLIREIAAVCQKYGTNVANLGQMSHEQLLGVYQKTRALIFPSVSESFGLPLVEARELGLPIIAPELDYVRDVCAPVETFDPHSAISIARAVKRFLGAPEPAGSLHSPKDFWSLFNESGAPQGHTLEGS